MISYQTAPIVQSNPVLFVLIGDAAVLAPSLMQLLGAYRLCAADCVIVPDADFGHLRAEINRIQQDFLAHRYTTVGLARVCYLLHDASFLVALRAHVEGIFSPLYPSGLITDIYWLADESGTQERRNRNRADSMAVLHGGLPDAQTYLLSNLNSESRHVPWEEVLQTVALLTLFKDGEPREYPIPPDASRFSEYRFLGDAAPGAKKPFLTAGSARLQVPQKALRAQLMTSLLSPLPLNAPAPPPLTFPKAAPHKYDDEFLYALALPPETAQLITDKMPRRTILARLFGTRLDTINGMHPPATADNDFAAAENALAPYGLFEALAITRPGTSHAPSATATPLADAPATAAATPPGAWPAAIAREITANDAALTAARDALETWLDTRTHLKELRADRRQLAFYYKTAHYPHTLAEEYLKRRAQIRAYEALGEMLQALQAFVAELHSQLDARRATLEDVRLAYEADAQGLTLLQGGTQGGTQSDPRTAPHDNPDENPLTRTAGYFARLFAAHARAHAAALRTLTHAFRTQIPLVELEEYIEQHLLTDPAFARSFPELLSHIADDENITAWAAAQRHTHIRLRTALPYAEANLHLHADRAAQVKRGYEALCPGRVNLFADADADRVSVLYHAGAFGPADIYYAELYKADENLQAKKPPRARTGRKKLPLDDGHGE